MKVEDIIKIVDVFSRLEDKDPLSDDSKIEKYYRDSPWGIGKKYHIRTVTMHLTGQLKFIGDKELVLESAAWIADSGRFSNFLDNPIDCSNEVEPFKNDVIVGRGSIIDATEIYELPKDLKG